MNDLMEFLTSQEIMVVYLIDGILCLICFISYIIKSNSKKYRMRNNTRELNKLVEKIQEKVPVKEEKVIDEKPILQTISSDKMKINTATVQGKANSVVELLDNTAELKEAYSPKVQENISLEQSMETSISSIEDAIEKEPVIIESKEVKPTDELQYTSVEPTPEDAKYELERLKDKLREQEKLEPEIENIALNNYEEEQEASAIISLDELVKKSKDMYEANEATQYDEGNVPISIQDLEKTVGEKVSTYEESFKIENVVPEEILNEDEEALDTTDSNTYEYQTVEAKSNNLIQEPIKQTTTKKFKSSPIISPIYGIEKSNEEAFPTELELENTANYEKLDEEIKKTNEFLMTLRELQKKLD